MAEKKTKPKAAREKVLSIEEQADRLRLTDYVVDMLGYAKREIKPPKQLFMRLEGLRHGEYIGSAKKSNKGVCYPYKIILYTIMAKRKDIDHALKTVSFKDESHKINYILIIIEKNINDIFQAVERKNIARDKIVDKEIHISTDKVEFRTTEKPKSEELFGDDMW